ncbi:MAG: gamma-glutamyltransferase [Proteobacteria bacterium]|nr:gamma-glutamyltransferase [Pseudomonadota bacterium]
MPNFAIAAGHELTAAAAEDILRAGGTAVDAAVAGALVACVAEPVLAGLLGGGFLMVRAAQGRAELLDCFVQTPKRKLPEAELDFRAIRADFGETTQEFHIGAASIATPGLAPGLAEAHARFGRMGLRDLVAPAVRLAREGVTVTEFQARLGRIIAPILKATTASRALMCGDDGEPLAAGSLYRNPDFADLLEVFGHEGPRFVTEGEVASGLLALAREGGHLGPEDLKAYRPEWRRPVEIARGPARIAVNPPPALGGVLVAFALELIGPGDRAADLARAFEATSRARLEAGLRGDIEAGPEDPIMRLLSPALVARYRAEVQGRKAATRGTTQISVVDANGMGAALTISNGEGNGSIIPGTGIMPNNMLGEDDLVPGAWHSWAPDTRLASMMTPMAVSWPDGALAMLGSGGSNRIRTALAQVLVNLLDRGMALGDAVEAPRLHVEGGDPPAVDFELPGLAEEDRVAILAAFGQARGWAERSMFYGGVHAVTRDRRGNVHAAGDPRRAGVALVV